VNVMSSLPSVISTGPSRHTRANPPPAHIEIPELLAFNIEREHPLACVIDALVGFRKAYLARHRIGQCLCEFGHAVTPAW
jgi:hypothetical protein